VGEIPLDYLCQRIVIRGDHHSLFRSWNVSASALTEKVSHRRF
jgi:hypothetical protein